jgi:hypothetical protein
MSDRFKKGRAATAKDLQTLAQGRMKSPLYQLAMKMHVREAVGKKTGIGKGKKAVRRQEKRRNDQQES